MSVKVSMGVVKSIIGRNINESINKDHIINMLTTALDSHTLETLVDICCTEDEYVPFQIGFIVSFEQEGNINHYDHGLMHGLNTRYGVIKQSDDYGTTFNPYYYKMNIDMFDLNDKNEVIMTPIDKYSNEITVVIGEALTDLRNIYESISTS